MFLTTKCQIFSRWFKLKLVFKTLNKFSWYLLNIALHDTRLNVEGEIERLCCTNLWNGGLSWLRNQYLKSSFLTGAQSPISEASDRYATIFVHYKLSKQIYCDSDTSPSQVQLNSKDHQFLRTALLGRCCEIMDKLCMFAFIIFT